MGYRSEVTIAMPKELVEDFEMETTQIAKQFLFFTHQDTWWDHKVENVSDTHTYYELNSWKFYDSYTDVKLLRKLCTAYNRMIEVLDSGNVVAILRVGEEAGDIEDYYSNAYKCGMATATEIIYV